MKINPSVQLFAPCKPDGVLDPLLKDTLQVSAAASTITTIGGTSGYPIPTGRGNVLAMEIVVGSNTFADVDGCTITLLGNGIQILNNDPLIQYSSFYQNDRRPMLINIPEAAKISGQIVNDSGNIIPVFIVFYFYDPYAQGNLGK